MDRTDLLLSGALIAYVLAFLQLVVSFRWDEARLRRWPVLVSTGAGLGAHTVWLVRAALQFGHLPIISTQEVFALLAWAIAVYYLILRRTHPRADVLGLLVLPIVALFTLVALVSTGSKLLPEELADLLRMPALPLHIGFMMLAYAGFLLAFLAALMYLLQERELKRKRFGIIYRYFPSLSACETLGHRSLLFGFLMLTLGIGMGIILLHRSDPVFWRGDPIIVLGFVTWLFYLVVVHYRLAAGWRGRRAAMLLIVGFLATAATFVSARLFGHIL
ncbi:MAG: cytochrome c biogenesis protein [Blastocatellia bacterium]|nr:cytochrome c biogenesis protein [Blastocatellia bacterium]